MSPETSTRMTYDDLLLLPEDGLRHEIIDGEHYVNASPVTKHQRVSIRLIVEISFYLREHPVGELFHAPLDIVFSRYDVVERTPGDHHDEKHPGFSRSARRNPLRSNRKYDEVTKRALYERTEVGEYWIVDPDHDTVRVFRRNAAGRYEITADLSRNDTLASPTLEISLDEIFA